MKTKQFVAAAVAAVLFLVTGLVGVSTAREQKLYTVESVTQFRDLFTGQEAELPDEDFLACIDITGTIQPSSSGSVITGADGGYDHTLYMDFIDDLMDDPNNQGIYLFVDSPGGTVYECDELYLKLMEYKEKTSRPIYAYFAGYACSAAYYISMAADEIYANRNAVTGSIGVLMSFLNYQELMEKIGLKEITITTGPNKTMGSASEELTEEQRAIFQSYVDECYEQFLGIVAEGRGLPMEEVRTLADGRIYTARQALENGMIDHIMGEEEALDQILEQCGLDPDAPLYSPESESPMDWFHTLIYQFAGVREKSELEVFQELARNQRNGVLMSYAG